MDKDYTCEDWGTQTEWTQIKVTVALDRLDEAVAVMNMVSNYLQIEDYSDIDLKTCYGDLIDESILNADKTVASVSLFLPADQNNNMANSFILFIMKKAKCVPLTIFSRMQFTII